MTQPDGTPLVEAIVPVHDVGRPIGRAVGSLLRSGLDPRSELRITVVCHNIDVDRIGALLPPDARDVVRLLSLEDGVPSPAGPFNLGIAAADGRFVTIMGSDDQLADGALAAWVAFADRQRLDLVIPPERHDSGKVVRTPPVRPGRRAPLHPLRDRLAYRTAPLGLLRRELFAADPSLRFPGHLRNGSDQIVGLRLWFSGARIGYARGLPPYIVGSDASTRVTFTVRTAEDEFAAVRDLVGDPWFRARSGRERRAIVAKTVRVHLFSGALVRTTADRWTPEDREHLAGLVELFAELAPGYERVLSIADRRLLDALAAGDASTPALATLLRQRTRFGHPMTVLPRDPRRLLAADGPLRFMVAARLL